MSGKKTEEEAAKFRGMMKTGLAQLQCGLPTWHSVCREVLELDGQPTTEEIVKALHSAIHRNQRDREGAGRTTCDKVCITAAWCLLWAIYT